MRGKTDLPPQPSTQLACQPGKLWAEPAASERASGAAVSGSAANTFAWLPRSFKAAAIPQDKPPPPKPATTASTSGRSSRISSPTEALPAIKSSSSKGCTKTRRHGGMTAVGQRLPAIVVGSLHKVGSQTANRIELGCRRRVDHKDLAGTPALRAASATPWAALPALTVQTPHAAAASGKSRIALYAPRILNDPIGCRHSNFR
jgi:hypothetical protein